jgi:hypothetical protein
MCSSRQRMRRSSPAAGSLSELAALGDTHDDDGCSPPALPLDGPPVASDANWTPAPVKKSPSDPNIARLPGKLVSRLLTRLLTLLVQRLAGTNRLVALIFAEFLSNLRKSEWLMKLVGRNVCQPVVQGIASGTQSRPDGDGLPFLGLNSPRPLSTVAARSPASCPSSSPDVCSRTPSPRSRAGGRGLVMPPLTLGTAAIND